MCSCVKRLESTLVHSVKGRGEEVKSLATRGVRVIKLTVSRKQSADEKVTLTVSRKTESV